MCLDHPENRKRCAAAGIAAPLVAQLAAAENEDSIEKSLWLTTNLTRDDKANRVELARAGMLSVLVVLLQDPPTLNITKNTCKALLNFLHEEQLHRQFVSAGGIEPLVNMVSGPNTPRELQVLTAMLLLDLTAFDPKIRSALLAVDVQIAVANFLLFFDCPELQRNAAMILNNLSLDDANEQQLLACGCIEDLCALLESQEAPVRREALAALAAFSAFPSICDEMRVVGGIAKIVDVIEYSTPDRCAVRVSVCVCVCACVYVYIYR
jgi:hypothetical protein